MPPALTRLERPLDGGQDLIRRYTRQTSEVARLAGARPAWAAWQRAGIHAFGEPAGVSPWKGAFGKRRPEQSHNRRLCSGSQVHGSAVAPNVHRGAAYESV